MSFSTWETLFIINWEIYSAYDYGRGGLQRNLLPLNTFEEQGRRNGSNTLKSHQNSQQDAFPREVSEKLEGHPREAKIPPPSPGWQKVLSAAEGSPASGSAPRLASWGHPGAWPVAVVNSRALGYLNQTLFPWGVWSCGSGPREAVKAEEGSGKSSCLHSGWLMQPSLSWDWPSLGA